MRVDLLPVFEAAPLFVGGSASCRAREAAVGASRCEEISSGFVVSRGFAREGNGSLFAAAARALAEVVLAANELLLALRLTVLADCLGSAVV